MQLLNTTLALGPSTPGPDVPEGGCADIEPDAPATLFNIGNFSLEACVRLGSNQSGLAAVLNCVSNYSDCFTSFDAYQDCKSNNSMPSSCTYDVIEAALQLRGDAGDVYMTGVIYNPTAFNATVYSGNATFTLGSIPLGVAAIEALDIPAQSQGETALTLDISDYSEYLTSLPSPAGPAIVDALQMLLYTPIDATVPFSLGLLGFKLSATLSAVVPPLNLDIHGQCSCLIGPANSEYEAFWFLEGSPRQFPWIVCGGRTEANTPRLSRRD